MVVLLDNCLLGVRHRETGLIRDDYGDRVPVGWGPANGGLMRGRRNEQADGMWALAVDPSLWPVRQDDLVISTDGTWLVNTSDLITNSYDDYVNYVRITARLRSKGGTEPGDAWFVARYTPGLEEVPIPSDGPPVWTEPHLWVGNGPPPEDDFGARVGDEYLDALTGIIYQLGED